MSEQSKSERKDIAGDGDHPGQLEVVQVDGEPCLLQARTFCDEGICVCVVHDGQFALVFDTDGAREFASALVTLARRVDDARRAIEGEPA